MLFFSFFFIRQDASLLFLQSQTINCLFIISSAFQLVSKSLPSLFIFTILFQFLRLEHVSSLKLHQFERLVAH